MKFDSEKSGADCNIISMECSVSPVLVMSKTELNLKHIAETCKILNAFKSLIIGTDICEKTVQKEQSN